MNKKMIVAGVIVTLIIVVGAIEIYRLTMPSAPTSEIPPQIVTHSSHIANETSVRFFVVFGVVQNNLETNINSVNVTASFYDAEDDLTGTSYAPVIPTILESQRRGAFEIYLLLDSYTNVPATYELTLSYLKTDEEPVAGLEISDQTSSIDEDGYYIVYGEAQNKAKRKAHFVNIICTYFNSNGNVIAISRTYVSSEIDSSEKVAFEISSKPHKIIPVSYELLIVAHHFDPLFVTNTQILIVLIAVFTIFLAYMRYRGW